MSIWSKLFSNFQWQNRPSTATPLGKINLQKLNDAIDGIDDRVVSLKDDKAETTDVTTALAEKVDKVAGKGLSTNDYTTAEKTKLTGIETGAQVNTVTGVKGNSESTYRTGNINITKANIGLGNVDNTSDANKPISTATQTALDNKVDKVEGKGLSTEDYTTAEKTKLAGISEQANKVEITPVVTEGTTLATISIDGVDTDIKGSDIDVDDELSPTSENPVQNKVITATLEDKADKDGNYEDMAVGQLLSNTFEEDKVPYNFRTAGGTLEIGDREYDTLVGGTVAFNQLVQNGNFASTTGWGANNGISISATNNELTVSVDSDPSDLIRVQGSVPATIIDHIYLQKVDAKSSQANIMRMYCPADNSTTIFNITTTYSSCYTIRKATRSGSVIQPFRLNITDTKPVGSTYTLKNFNFIDLTQMFGSTIADYIYSLEQATAGSGVAYFRSLFPKDYYEYNAGQLMSVKALSHKMVGFNQWDEEWESGAYDSAGAKKVDDTQIRAKNFCPCLPYIDYYQKMPTNGRVLFYDENKNFISRTSGGKDRVFTTPVNARYFTLYFVATTYENNCCISIRWDGERDGEYEAYEEHIYPLDSDLELRGIPKLDANNKLYYDGDTYESDGTVTRKYGFRAYQGGDEGLADAITDGTNTVYKLTTPTTETADTFENPQLVSNWGTEEYTDSRTIQIPVGHITKYPPDLKAKLESAPDSPASDGDYILRHNNGVNTYVADTKELPTVPTTDGTYVLKATVSSGTATLSWVEET